MSGSTIHQPSTVESADGPIYTTSKTWLRSSTWSFHKSRHSAGYEPEKFAETYGGHIHRGNDTGSCAHDRDSRTPINSRISMGFKHAGVFLAFTLPVVTFIVITNVPKLYHFHSEYLNTGFNHCNFNALFTPFNKPSISLWDVSGTFYITVTWGSMAFSTAKLIDIVWDNVVGRGGQAFLGYITYQISSQYLSMAMREAPVPYSTYEAFAFVPPTFIRILRLIRDLLLHRGMRARLIIVWIVLSSLFVLSFSSFATAMAGYSSNTYAVMYTHEGERVAWEDYQLVHFVISDAWRIGEPGPVVITNGDSCIANGFLEDDNDGTEDTESEGEEDEDDPWEYVPANCSMFWHTVQYVNEYGLHGSQQIGSVFTVDDVQHNLSSPTLNITTSFPTPSLTTLSGCLTDLTNGVHPSQLASISDISPSSFWTYENETYTWSYVLNNASCRYNLHHNWGFSFIILFITSLLFALWAIGTYALWLFLQLHDPVGQKVSTPGTTGIYRSSWDLVEALKNDFGDDVVQPELRDADIRSMVRRRAKGGATGVRSSHGIRVTACAEVLQTSPEPRAPPMWPPDSYMMPTPWQRLRSLLQPRSNPNEPFLPYGSSTSSQAHILHTPAAATISVGTSSPTSITSPSTVFSFSSALPVSPSPSMETNGAALFPDIGERARRPTLKGSRFSSSSYSHSLTPSPSGSLAPGWLDIPTAAGLKGGKVVQAAASRKQTSKPCDASDRAPNAGLQFKYDLGDDQ